MGKCLLLHLSLFLLFLSCFFSILLQIECNRHIVLIREAGFQLADKFQLQLQGGLVLHDMADRDACMTRLSAEGQQAQQVAHFVADWLVTHKACQGCVVPPLPKAHQHHALCAALHPSHAVQRQHLLRALHVAACRRKVHAEVGVLKHAPRKPLLADDRCTGSAVQAYCLSHRVLRHQRDEAICLAHGDDLLRRGHQALHRSHGLLCRCLLFLP
mmetsp:Transcript_1308/g.3137  ORF Transcript_1308/g.3137 Transcript_1308/m.3137 type:complete len:214 (-) Transcript_1308:1425-2066(-)